MSNPIQEAHEIITLPAITTPITKRKNNTSTGDKLDKSAVRYEVTRMLLDGMSYKEIELALQALFGIKAAELTIVAFKENYYPYYKDLIDRVDKARHSHIVARISDEMKASARGMVSELLELQKAIVIIDERIALVRALPAESRTASYEGTLKDFIGTKVRILERIAKITGSSGLESRMIDVVKRTALAAQRTLVQHLNEDEAELAFEMFESEMRTILDTIASGLETTPPAEIS